MHRLENMRDQKNKQKRDVSMKNQIFHNNLQESRMFHFGKTSRKGRKKEAPL